MSYNRMDTLLIDDNYNNDLLQRKLIRKYRLLSLIFGILFLICLITLIPIAVYKRQSYSSSKCSSSTNQSSITSGCKYFTRQNNWNYPQNDMLNAVVKDYDACCSMCWYQTSCMAFSYSPTKNFCWLKTKIIEGGGHQHQDRISGYISVCRSENIIDKRGLLARNSSENELDEGIIASHWRTCCGLCLRQTSCIAYTYSPTTHRCWLKTEVIDEIDDPDKISGRLN